MKNTKKYKLVLKKEKCYNNGNIIINAMDKIHENFINMLSKEIDIVVVEREEKSRGKYAGISADDLNKKLRGLLKECTVFHDETHVENGVFFHDTKEGFDFTLYDETYNTTNLFNYYIGEVGIFNGKDRLLAIYKKLKKTKKDWKSEVEQFIQNNGENKAFVADKKELTIVGEFQFGNWGLVYRDLFRLLDANNKPGVDMYIYITATGNLCHRLSSNIVNYEKTIEVIEEYNSILKVPMWIIGLDVEEV